MKFYPSTVFTSTAAWKLAKTAAFVAVLVAIAPATVQSEPLAKKGTTPYVTHFIFRPLMTIDTAELGKATTLEAVGTTQNMQALTANADGLAFTYRVLIAKLALARRLPLAVWSRDTLEAGALLAYGADNSTICRRTAVYVDKILKGMKPGELPVEQPTKFLFLINLKTSKALDLDIPLFLQQRADEVIE